MNRRLQVLAAAVAACAFLLLAADGRASEPPQGARPEGPSPRLADHRAPRPGEIAQVDLNPLKADFFDLVERELRLQPDDVAKLAEHGFVLIDPQADRSFPTAYYHLYSRDLPLLITTDSILHAFHHTYDAVLSDLESRIFAVRLQQLLADVHAALQQNLRDSAPAELAASCRDVDLYLAIARNLLAGSSPGRLQVPSLADQDAAVAEILAAIQHPESAAMQPARLYGGRRTIDFTQFLPRGHYTKTPLLSKYFVSMMWLGRVDCGFNILPTDSTTGVESTGRRELRAAALLVQLLASTGSLAAWQQIEDMLSYMVGQSDNVNVAQLLPLLKECELVSAEDLLDGAKLARLEAAILNGPAAEQRIRSQVLFNQAGAPGAVRPPAVFQLFGQRFALDSFALSQVVHDATVSPRSMPTGLDVMASLGNDLALGLLEPELNRWGYLGNLLAVRGIVRGTPDAYWRDNLYGGWLNLLCQLDRDLTTETDLPQVFRTAAWRRKQLQTQLASWSELRHDTILYAKASYDVPQCEVPAAYVEPYPEFYAAMAELARGAAERLKDIPQHRSPYSYSGGWGGGSGLPNDGAYAEFFSRMAGSLEMLERIAKKEIAGTALDAEETHFLETTISQRGNVLFGSGAVHATTYDGWYPRLMYGFGEEEQNSWQATIADVHTDVQNGQVLEVGVGRVNWCVAAADQPEGTRIYVGPVYSYYEFPHPAGDRLTDGRWQSMLRSSPPGRPDFLLPLAGQSAGENEPLVQAERKGDMLLITVDPRSRQAGVPGVHRVELSAAGLQTIPRLAAGLRNLDASGRPMTDADLECLKPLADLKAVDLSGTQLTGTGLASLSGSRFLRRLALKGTGIGDAALSALAEWPYLETLDLRDTAITDEGLRRLAGRRYLRQLMLEGTRVTADGVESLRKALPDCRVSASVGGEGEQ